jgi:hypothetical protein
MTVDFEQDLIPSPEIKDKPNYFTWLKFLSLGQYRTPLYYKRSDSYSSICGGILTLLGVAAVMAFSYFTFVPIIDRSHKNFIHEDK